MLSLRPVLGASGVALVPSPTSIKIGIGALRDELEVLLRHKFGSTADVTIGMDPATLSYDVYAFVIRYDEKFKCKCQLDMFSVDDALTNPGRMKALLLATTASITKALYDVMAEYLERLGLR